MAKTTSDAPKPLSVAAQDVVDKFNASWKYAQQNHHKRWQRNWKLYNNQRTDQSYVGGVTNTFIPMVFSIVETATAALTGGRPSIDFVPQDMYQYIMSYYTAGKKPDLKALNAQFDYYWDCDNWDLKTIKTVRNGFTYGIAGEWISWNSDKPQIINLGPRDIIIDPNVSDPMQLITDPDDYYTGRRYLTTLDALKGETLVDPNRPGEVKPRFKNLDKVTPNTLSGEQTTKEQKEMLIGALNGGDGMVEVIEIWTGKKIRSVANRTVTIEDRKNELGIHCLGLHRFIADESIIYGKAIIDPIAAQQEYLNDLSNQRLDAITDVLSPQWELDPIYSDQTALVTNAPGTVYPFRPGALKMLEKRSIETAAFNEGQNIKNEIREAVGVDQIVQGAGADGQTTATEINAQLNQAGQRFSLFVRMLEREGLYQRAKIVYRMMMYYIKDKQLVPTVSLDGPQFRQFDPSQFNDTYEPRIQLESNVRTKRRAEQQSSLQSFEAMIADPTNDLWEVKKIMYPKMFDLTEEELDRVIGPEKPEPQGMGDPMAGGIPPEMAGMPPEADTEPVEPPLAAEVMM